MIEATQWRMDMRFGQVARLTALMAIVPLLGSCINVITAVPSAIIAAPLTAGLYGAIAACQLAKITPPEPVPFESNVAVSVGKSVFQIERLAVAKLAGSNACFASIYSRPTNLIQQVGGKDHAQNDWRYRNEMSLKVNAVFHEAAGKFIKMDFNGCRIGRISVRGPNPYASHGATETYAERAVDENGTFVKIPMSHC
jgi:hypothetical protein